MKRNWTLPQGVCAIITRPSDGHILLHKRCRRVRLYPGRWAFFGGGVEPGESLEQALVRELHEETGMRIAPPTYLWGTVHHKPCIRAVCDHTFWIAHDGQPVVLGEGEASEWFSVEYALERLNLPPHEVTDLARFQRLSPMMRPVSMAHKAA